KQYHYKHIVEQITNRATINTAQSEIRAAFKGSRRTRAYQTEILVLELLCLEESDPNERRRLEALLVMLGGSAQQQLQAVQEAIQHANAHATKVEYAFRMMGSTFDKSKMLEIYKEALEGVISVSHICESFQL